jgi:hypothetical protein
MTSVTYFDLNDFETLEEKEKRFIEQKEKKEKRLIEQKLIYQFIENYAEPLNNEDFKNLRTFYNANSTIANERIQKGTDGLDLKTRYPTILNIRDIMDHIIRLAIEAIEQKEKELIDQFIRNYSKQLKNKENKDFENLKTFYIANPTIANMRIQKKTEDLDLETNYSSIHNKIYLRYIMDRIIRLAISIVPLNDDDDDDDAVANTADADNDDNNRHYVPKSAATKSRPLSSRKGGAGTRRNKTNRRRRKITHRRNKRHRKSTRRRRHRKH